MWWEKGYPYDGCGDDECDNGCCDNGGRDDGKCIGGSGDERTCRTGNRYPTDADPARHRYPGDRDKQPGFRRADSGNDAYRAHSGE